MLCSLLYAWQLEQCLALIGYSTVPFERIKESMCICLIMKTTQERILMNNKPRWLVHPLALPKMRSGLCPSLLGGNLYHT